MQKGVRLGFQSFHGVSDMKFFRMETQIAIDADATALDFATLVEHQYPDYAGSMSYERACNQLERLADKVTPWAYSVR